MQNLPPSVTQQPSGDAEIMRDVFTRFGLALATAVLMIFASASVPLVQQLYLSVAVMASTAPLQIGCAPGWLYLIYPGAPRPLRLIGNCAADGSGDERTPFMLGGLCLMAKQQGKIRYEAVVEAGVTRPAPDSLMTSISTLAGNGCPLPWSWVLEERPRSPMAIAVIGGFTTSTLLTLVVVPVIFTYIDGLNDEVFRSSSAALTDPSEAKGSEFAKKVNRSLTR